MINYYFENKDTEKQYQVLTSWKDYYIFCGNDWEVTKIDRKIERFEETNCE